MFEPFIEFVREIYGTNEFIPLHEPRFIGNEKEIINETIDSTFVSTVGEHVNNFETLIAEYTGVRNAVSTVNGTSALHIALKMSGVGHDTEVITQSLTFVATTNAIHYCNAKPIFVDVDKETLGLCPNSLMNFLEEYCELRNDGYCWNKASNKKIVACIPMHTYGFPVKLEPIVKICEQFNIVLIEDAAESLGSLYENKHTGNFGKISVMSFNGNKIITTGGGGMLLTNDSEISKLAKHVTTTAKIPHPWKFDHDLVGYNYRLPNLNAALGVAQMNSLPKFIQAKRIIAKKYQEWGIANGYNFVCEPENTKANYWLNVVITKNKKQRDEMLEITNKNNVMTRPAWTPMHKLKINQPSLRTDLINTDWLFDRLVNVPSSVPQKNE